MSYYRFYRSSNKYKNVRLDYNGSKYRSKLEVRTAMDLDLLVRAKKIKRWERERCIDIFFVKVKDSWILRCYLEDSQGKAIIGKSEMFYKEKGYGFRHFKKYYIDFIVWHIDGMIELLETKGLELEPWKMKWSLLDFFCEDCPNIKLTVQK